MDPDELTALLAQITAATVAVLAATGTVAQDKIETEAARDIIVADLAMKNSLIAQLTNTRSSNTNLTVPTFYLTPG